MFSFCFLSIAVLGVGFFGIATLFFLGFSVSLGTATLFSLLVIDSGFRPRPPTRCCVYPPITLVGNLSPCSPYRGPFRRGKLFRVTGDRSRIQSRSLPTLLPFFSCQRTDAEHRMRTFSFTNQGKVSCPIHLSSYTPPCQFLSHIVFAFEKSKKSNARLYAYHLLMGSSSSEEIGREMLSGVCTV